LPVKTLNLGRAAQTAAPSSHRQTTKFPGEGRTGRVCEVRGYTGVRLRKVVKWRASPAEKKGNLLVSDGEPEKRNRMASKTEKRAPIFLPTVQSEHRCRAGSVLFEKGGDKKDVSDGGEELTSVGREGSYAEEIASRGRKRKDCGSCRGKKPYGRTARQSLTGGKEGRGKTKLPGKKTTKPTGEG